MNVNVSKNGGWKLVYRVPDAATYFSFQSRDLIRSADFAGFVQQFRRDR